MRVITAKGSVEKHVVCESCGHGYSYTMTREAIGSHHGFALTGAEQDKKEAEDAAQRLKEKLKSEYDVRPCPRCGALTRQMRSARIRLPFVCLGGAVLSAGMLGALYAFGLRSGHWFIGAAIIFGGFFILFVIGCLLFSIGLLLMPLRKNRSRQPDWNATAIDKSAPRS